MNTILLLLTLAQVPGYPSGCPTCKVYGWVDTPTYDTVTSVTRTSQTLIEGWGFRCQDGAPIDRIDVWYRGDDGYFHPAGSASFVAYIPRWDVVNAYSPACPAVSSVTGFEATFDSTGIPAGARDVQFNLWRGPLLNEYPQVRRMVFQ